MYDVYSKPHNPPSSSPSQSDLIFIFCQMKCQYAILAHTHIASFQ